MNGIARVVLLSGLCLAGCRTLTSGEDDWLAYMRQVDGMNMAQLRAERETCAALYAEAPDDQLRMRLAYVLSHPIAPVLELERGRRVLQEIPGDSPWAGRRDLLSREITLMIELQTAQGQVLELQAQLEALKAIEKEMIDRRQDEVDR